MTFTKTGFGFRILALFLDYSVGILEFLRLSFQGSLGMMKGDRMAKRSSLGSIARKRLSDITNSLPQPKSPIDLEKPLLDDASSAKDYIDHLVKDNMALVKLIQDKNKIIELSGLELQKLRASLQKLQMQNWNLAQSNSHMIAELNLGKDKLKLLRHELTCKEALLKAKSNEAKEQERTNCENMQNEEAVIQESRANEDKKTSNGSRRHHAIRSRSMGHSTTSQQVIEKEAAENKRRCLRRKSASFKIQQQEEPSENLFEIEETKLPIVIQSDIPTPLPSFDDKEVQENEKNSSQIHLPRSSLGRPLRKAAEKVQSYKEIPLNVKMRRTK